MPRRALQPEGMAVPTPPYSPVVVSGDTVYTAGQIANDPGGNLVEGGMHNCNFFDIDADGKFSRVIIWMAGTNPLK